MADLGINFFPTSGSNTGVIISDPFREPGETVVT